MKILIILLLSLSAVFCDLSPKYVTIKNALSTFKNFVTNYDEKLDQSAKFPELQAAIDVISASMQNYDGKAKSHLPKIKSLNNEGRVKYTNCVGPVYEWCVGMNTTLNIIVKYIDEGMSVKDRKMAWNLAGNLLRHGLKKTTGSLYLLGQVQLKMNLLQTEFEHLVRDIKEDFSPDGKYGKERGDMLQSVENAENTIRKELQNQRKAQEAENTQHKRAKRAVWLLDFLFTAFKTIVDSPMGDKLGLTRTFYENNLDHYVKGNSYSVNPTPFNYARSNNSIKRNKKKIYNKQEKIEAIQLLFSAIQKQIKTALEITIEVQAALITESNHLHQLNSLIETIDFKRGALLGDNEDQQRDLIPSFMNLGESCRQYATRHGYSVEVSKNISRNRRQAVNLCQEKKDRYEEILMNSFNATGEDGQKRDIARSIAQNMQCETVYLLTANWNDPDTSANYDI